MVLLQGEEEKEGETTFLQQFRYTHNGHHPAKEIPVPDYTTLCRRRRKIVIPKVNRRKGGLCLVVDSTGLKTVGAGEWREVIERGRKSWLKIHIAYDYTSGEVIGDSAHDSRKIYQEIEERGARGIIPPRKGARICHYFGKGPPTQRDNHVSEIGIRIGLINQWRELGRLQTIPSAS